MIGVVEKLKDVPATILHFCISLGRGIFQKVVSVSVIPVSTGRKTTEREGHLCEKSHALHSTRHGNVIKIEGRLSYNATLDQRNHATSDRGYSLALVFQQHRPHLWSAWEPQRNATTKVSTLIEFFRLRVSVHSQSAYQPPQTSFKSCPLSYQGVQLPTIGTPPENN